MNQCISIIASLSLGFSLGAGGTAIGNSWWVEADTPFGGEVNMGLWRLCIKAAAQEDCQNTWDKDSIKDSVYFISTLALWTGGLAAMVIAEILWIVFSCKRGHAKGCLTCVVGFAFLGFGCWLSTVLIWWLRLLKDDDAFLPFRDSLEFAWAYWVAVGATGLSLLAFIFSFIMAYSLSKQQSV